MDMHIPVLWTDYGERQGGHTYSIWISQFVFNCITLFQNMIDFSIEICKDIVDLSFEMCENGNEKQSTSGQTGMKQTVLGWTQTETLASILERLEPLLNPAARYITDLMHSQSQRPRQSGISCLPGKKIDRIWMQTI